MFHFDRFGPDPVALSRETVVASEARLVFDPNAEMDLTVRRSERTPSNGAAIPTLVICGKNRAPDDWLGLEIDLPGPAHDVEMTARNYPAHRLFPRLHFDTPQGTRHLDLPDVAASDQFATRVFSAGSWLGTPALDQARKLRLTVLIPSTPWFAMEIQPIRIHSLSHA